MNDFFGQWAVKTSEALSVEDDLRRRLDIINELKSELDLSEGKNIEGYQAALDNLIGWENQTKEEIMGNEKRGDDLINWYRDCIGEAIVHYVGSQHMPDIPTDDRYWQELQRLTNLVCPLRLEDEARMLLLKYNTDKKKVYEFLLDVLIKPSEARYKEMKKLMTERGYYSKGFTENILMENKAILTFVYLMDDLVGVTKQFKPELLIGTAHQEDEIKKWVIKVDLFLKIEDQLFKRGYIAKSDDGGLTWLVNSHNNERKRTIRMLVDLWVLLKNKYLIFRHERYKKIVKDYQTRQFLSARYGLGKTRLNDCFKDYKPLEEQANGSFKFLEDAILKNLSGEE